MTTNEPPPDETPGEGQSESVGPPVPDDAPPRRGPQPFIWLAILGVVVIATVALLLALAAGVL